jgi:protein-glutamine gamma-glutamyltransferase
VNGKTSYGYFGFSDKLDTSVRGRPDETLVMRVRSSAPDFWRGQTFDVWDGRTWSLSDEDVRPLVDTSPIEIPAIDPPPQPGRELVQTFYVEEQGPNLVFAAYTPAKVYFADRTLFQMSDGTLRTGVQLVEKSIYTVISRRPVASPERLRASDGGHIPPDLLERYTALPAVPKRVTDLAREVTANAPTVYDKVRALEDWMGDNTQYSLDIPALPPGEDAVERFLFVDRKGFCEQIGTSLVVMLRSLGIPARLAVGYAAGKRNPFTGLYEVKASDAHSWVEVYFPGISAWQGFDPTAEVPLAGDQGPRSAGSGALSYVARAIPTRIPAGAARAVGVLVAAVAAGWAALTWLSFVRRRRADATASWPVAFARRLQAAGSARGRPREPSQTITEYVDQLAASVLPHDRLREVAHIVAAEAFAGAPPDAAAQQRAEAILEEAEQTGPARRGAPAMPGRR